MSEEKQNPADDLVTRLLGPVANTFANFVKLGKTGKVSVEIEFDAGVPVGEGIKVHSDELYKFTQRQNTSTQTQEGE